MKKMKQSVKTAVASTVILSSTVAAVYAVPQIIEKSSNGTGNELKLDVEKIDRDTVKVSIDNIQDIPRALQFSIKLDGNVELKDGADSIKDLIKPEVQARLAVREYSENNNNILTDYTYNEATNTIDVLITSDNSIPKTENKVEVFELDIKPKESVKDKGTAYKVVPNNKDDYKYLSVTNKEYDNLGVTFDNESITMNNQPTIEASKDYIKVVEGEELELTAANLGLDIKDEDGDTTTLEVRDLSQGSKPVITKFIKTTPGVYTLECTAEDSYGEKSTVIQIPIYVELDKVETAPTIKKGEEELQSKITINGGDIFKPLENVKATDAKGRNVEVTIESSAELNLDPENDTTYILTYKATDIYGNEAIKEVTLHVIANKAPVIEGVRDHSIKVGDKFDPKDGVTVTDEDTDIELRVESNVNTAVAGEYRVSYSATDSRGKTTRVQSKVVVNEKMVAMNNVPVITAEDQTIKLGDKFDELKGVTAYDKEDKDLTSKIKVEKNNVNENKVGQYIVQYSVEDSQKAKVTKSITVTVEDTEAPVFNYNGEMDVVLPNAAEYTIPNIEAIDNADGNVEVTRVITKDNVVINEIDTTVAGVYKITYTAIDESGNKSELTINVTVKDKIEIIEGEGTINLPTKIQVSKEVIIEDIKELINKIEKSYSYEFAKSPEVRENNKVYTLKIEEKLNVFKRLFGAKTNEHYIEIEVPNSNNDVIAYLDGLYAEVNAPVEQEKPDNGSTPEGGEVIEDQEMPDNSSRPENGSGTQVQSKPNNTSKVESEVGTTGQSTTDNTSKAENEVTVEEQIASNETSKLEDKVETNNEVKLDNDLELQGNESTETENNGIFKVVIAGVVVGIAALAGAIVYLNKKRKS